MSATAAQPSYTSRVLSKMKHPIIRKNPVFRIRMPQSSTATPSNQIFGVPSPVTPASATLDPQTVPAQADATQTPAPDLETVALETAEAVVENIIARRLTPEEAAALAANQAPVATVPTPEVAASPPGDLPPTTLATPIAPTLPATQAAPAELTQILPTDQPLTSSAEPVPTPPTPPTPQATPTDLPSTPPAEPVTESLPVSEAVPAQAIPLAVDQAIQAEQQQSMGLTPQQATSSAKEKVGGSSLDTGAIEAAAGIQVVEQEKNPEIPVEVEGFLQHVEDHASEAPQEIVLADLQQSALPTKVPKKAVVVLPITPEAEKAAKWKNTKFSVKWLVEWSKKIMKIFEGTVIYRPVEESK